MKKTLLVAVLLSLFLAFPVEAAALKKITPVKKEKAEIMIMDDKVMNHGEDSSEHKMMLKKKKTVTPKVMPKKSPTPKKKK